MNKKIIALLLIICISISSFFYYRSQHGEDIMDEDIPEGIAYTINKETLSVIKDIKVVEAMVVTILEDSGIEVTNDRVNQATMAFIRSKRYGYRTGGFKGLIWAGVVGEIEDEVGINLSQYSDEEQSILAKTDTMNVIVDSLQPIDIDFPHMVTVIDLALTDSEETSYREEYYDYLYSWGGDLDTFLSNMGTYGVETGNVDYDSMYDYAWDMIGNVKRSNFSLEDYYADMDGVNVAILMQTLDYRLSEALTLYYESERVAMRGQLFVASFGGEEAFKEAVKCFMLSEAPSDYRDDEAFVSFIDTLDGYKSLIRMMLDDQDMEPTYDMKVAATDAFINKILMQ